MRTQDLFNQIENMMEPKVKGKELRLLRTTEMCSLRLFW